MKNVITAIGNEQLNNILNETEIVKVLNQDIQYQEGIFEALEKYENVDTLIINENIIGALEIQELIRAIKMIRDNLEIVVISKNMKIKDGNNYITKMIDNNLDYVNEVVKYFGIKKNINQEPQLQNEREKLTQIRHTYKTLEKSGEKQLNKRLKYKESKNKYQNKIITVIGNYGVR